MKRRTFDLVVSAGGIAVAGLILLVASVLTQNANFAKNYVADQLSQQKISFKTAATLTDEEKKAGCLVANAGKALTSGKQAECYANEFIGLHLKSIANANGKTYAELGDTQTQLRAQITTATQTNSPTLPALQKQLADVTTARETVFKGETLRGLLLTSYGFSVFGDKAAQASTVMWIIAGILAALSVGGVVHAFVTPQDKGVKVPVQADTSALEADLARHIAAQHRTAVKTARGRRSTV